MSYMLERLGGGDLQRIDTGLQGIPASSRNSLKEEGGRDARGENCIWKESGRD